MGNFANRVKLTDYLLGQQASTALGRNYVLNPSAFENTVNVAVSGTATVSRNTTTPLTAISDFALTLPNNATDGVTWTLNTLDNALNGQNCEMRFDYTASSIGSNVVAQVLQGATIAAQSPVLAAVSTSKTISLNAPCGSLASATTLKITNFTGNSGTSAINIANIAYGKATNLSSIAQAQFYGSATWASTASCDWATSGTGSWVDFSANASCPTPTLTGNAVAPATKIPAITFTNLPPGTYQIIFSGGMYDNGSGFTGWRIFDGTNFSSIPRTHASSGATLATLTGIFTYTTTQASITFKPQSFITSSGNTNIYNATGDNAAPSLSVSVYYFPSQSQTVLTPNTSAQSWEGYFGTSTAWTNSNTSTSFTDFSSSSNTLNQTRNNNFGTVTAASGNLPGITWTPTSAGNYFVCVIGAMSSGSGTVNSAIALTDGSGNVISTVSLLSLTTTNAFPFTLCGLYNATSTAAQTVKIQGNVGANSIQTNWFGGSSNTRVSQLDFTIINISQSFPAPILVGSVTSNSSGPERIERAFITGGTSTTKCTSSPCTIQSQSGTWLSSVTRAAAGNYTLNFTSGMFSSAPTCTFQAGSAANNFIYVNTAPTTSSVQIQDESFSAGGTNIDDVFYVICMGPR